MKKEKNFSETDFQKKKKALENLSDDEILQVSRMPMPES